MSIKKQDIIKRLKEGKSKLLLEKLNDAIYFDDVKSLKEVFARGIDPKGSIPSYFPSIQTPFRLALLYGSVRVVHYYIEQNIIGVDERFEYNETPLELAILYGQLKLVRYFLEKYPFLKSDKMIHNATPLLVAAQYGHNNIIDYLINDQFSSFRERNEHGMTALLLTAANGHDHTIKYLLKMPHVSLLEQNYEGLSALSIAILRYHINTVRYLLNNGAYIDLQTFLGKRVLDLTKEEHPCFDLIRVAHFLIITVEQIHISPVALKEQLDNILENLSKDSPSLNARRKADGNTALQIALQKENEELSAKLILLHARLDLPNHKGETALDMIKKSNSLYLEACVFIVKIETMTRQFREWQLEQDDFKDLKDSKEALELVTKMKELKNQLLIKSEETFSLINKLENDDKSKKLKQRLGFLLADKHSPIFYPNLAFCFISESDFEVKKEDSPRAELESDSGDNSPNSKVNKSL